MFKTKKLKPAPPPPAEAFTSVEVSRISGVSLRQLQWWDEQHVVSPRHDGHRRVYLPSEVIEIAVIAELRRKGFSLQKIRRVLRHLQRDMGKRLGESFTAGQEMFLLTDGKTTHLEGSCDGVLKVLKGASQPMFLVSVSEQARLLEGPPKKPARSETAGASRKTRAV